MASVEFIYALEAEGVIFYTGRTNDPARRLREHKLDGDPKGNAKQRLIYELNCADIPFTLKILETGSAADLYEKEEVWRVRLITEGHQLTNERQGDSHPFLGFEPAKDGPKPWTVELFKQAEWTKGDPKAKSGEWSCWIKGVQFFRQGKRKLRMWHPEFGHWELGRVLDDNTYKRVCLKLTPGTKEHEDLKNQVASIIRMKGRSP